MQHRTRLAVVVLAVLITCSPAFAGMQARYWPTTACMLDFKNLNEDGNPTPIASMIPPGFGKGAGSTALSDAEGNLILFGDQLRIFDREMNQLTVTPDEPLNKDCVRGPQTAVLLPWPGEADCYCQVYASNEGTIAYTKVRPYDPAKKIVCANSPIPSTVKSKALTACATPDRRGYYIVSKTECADKTFQVLRLTEEGFSLLDAAVPKPPEDKIFGIWSNLKFSTDGRHLAYGATLDGTAVVPLYAFDPQTGAITLESTFNLETTTNRMGGVEFSPNGRYLYTGLSSRDRRSAIFQIDRQSGATLPLSTGAWYTLGCFQLAPNGDIYTCVGTENCMGRIRNPDLPAGEDGCTYSLANLGIGYTQPGLPVFIASDLRRTPAEIITTETTGILTVRRNPLANGVNATAYGLCWSTAAHPAPGGDNVVLAPDAGTSFDADLTDKLGSGVRYHVRAFVRGDDGQTYYGDEIELVIADLTPSALLSAAPADGAAGAPVGAPLRLTFTKPLEEKTLTGETVRLTDGAAVPGDLTVAGPTLTFTPRALLAPETAYTLTLSAGITDLSGNALAPLTITFTTAAPAADDKPEITATNVADGAESIPANITLMATFSKPMAVTTLSDRTVTLLCAGAPVEADVFYTPATRTVTLVPHAPLAADTECTFTITKDACSTSGNSLSADLVLHFTTAAPAADMDSDGVPDNEEDFPGDSTRATVTAVTNTGSFELDSSSLGAGVELAAVKSVSDQDPAVNSTGKPADRTFPDGLLAYRVINLTRGQTIEMPVRVPSGIPAGARIYKITDEGYTDVTDQCRISGDTITLTLIDGGPGDADGTADGIIDDPLGVAVPLDAPAAPWTAGDDEGGPCFVSSAGSSCTGLAVLLGALALLSLTGRRRRVLPALLFLTLLALPLQAAETMPARASGPWSISMGLGTAFYAGEAEATLNGHATDFTLDHELAPVARLNYALDENLTLQTGLRYDWYHWKVSPSLSSGDSDFAGWTLSLGPVWCFDSGLLPGDARPFAQAALTWRWLDGDLDAPVTEYKSAPGLELAGGVQYADHWELRAGLSWSRHEPEHTMAGTTDAEDLEIPGAFCDLTWRFDL